MNRTISGLLPEAIWRHFYALTQIPRPSGHEEAVIAHIGDFAQQHDLEFNRDKTGNLIVRKAASAGKEGVKKVILQSHVDMVPQKNSDKEHDFLKDPIEMVPDGEWIKANGTTLGADNGIGIAATLAVLESDKISHGPLEALFTISEETGMDGAFGLEPEALKGEILLNLDSEEEGELFMGCAGGVDVNVEASYTEEAAEGRAGIRIKVSGLRGGHSGMDINLGRANANLLLAGLISNLAEKMDIRIHTFSGGNLRNAIPREAEAVIAVGSEDVEAFQRVFRELAGKAGSDFVETEPDMQILYQEVAGGTGDCMKKEDQGRILELLKRTPVGVLQMSEQMPGIVQTSNNLAVVIMQGGILEIKMLLRSSSDEEKDRYAQDIQKLYENLEAKTGLSGAYPGWLPDADSAILKHAKAVYRDLFDKDAKVQVIHAGLECGIIGGTYPQLDMLSFGPTIKYPHSPDEKVHIASVDKFWKFLVGVLEGIDS